MKQTIEPSPSSKRTLPIVGDILDSVAGKLIVVGFASTITGPLIGGINTRHNCVAVSEKALPDYFKHATEANPGSFHDYLSAMSRLTRRPTSTDKTCIVTRFDSNGEIFEHQKNIVTTDQEYDFGIPVEQLSALRNRTAFTCFYDIGGLPYVAHHHFMGNHVGKPMVLMSLMCTEIDASIEMGPVTIVSLSELLQRPRKTFDSIHRTHAIKLVRT